MKKALIAVFALFSLNATAKDYSQFIEQDTIIGSITAPVTVINYASMTCGHCANFETNVLPEFKKEYIDTGKAAYALRDFPLDRLAYAVAKIQRCVPAEQFEPLSDAFFKYQREWLGAPDKLAAIKNISKLAGLSGEQVEACISNEKVQERIEVFRQSGVELGVNSTPTLFVNGKMHRGVGSFEQLKKIVDAELNK